MWTLFWRRLELLLQSPRTATPGTLCMCRRLERSSAKSRASYHRQCLCTCSCHRCAPDDMNVIKCGIYSRAATKRSAASIQANTVVYSSHCKPSSAYTHTYVDTVYSTLSACYVHTYIHTVCSNHFNDNNEHTVYINVHLPQKPYWGQFK